jgi:hypothetical protein
MVHDSCLKAGGVLQLHWPRRYRTAPQLQQIQLAAPVGTQPSQPPPPLAQPGPASSQAIPTIDPQLQLPPLPSHTQAHVHKHLQLPPHAHAHPFYPPLYALPDPNAPALGPWHVVPHQMHHHPGPHILPPREQWAYHHPHAPAPPPAPAPAPVLPSATPPTANGALVPHAHAHQHYNYRYGNEHLSPGNAAAANTGGPSQWVGDPNNYYDEYVRPIAPFEQSIALTTNGCLFPAIPPCVSAGRLVYRQHCT